MSYADVIVASKIFKGSKNQSKILAEIQDPVNKELVEQLDSYVSIDDYNELADKLKDAEAELSELKEGSPDIEGPEMVNPTKGGPSKSSTSSPSFAGHSSSGTFDSTEFDSGDFSDMEDAEFDEDLGEAEPAGDDSLYLEDDEPVAESTKVKKSPVVASTYVTMEKVSHAVHEIPGTLNLREETKGATHATLRGTSSNEIWVFYDDEVDLSKILGDIDQVIKESGYYFIDFNRVARDEHAVVFNVNWVSTYFNPYEFKDDEE